MASNWRNQQTLEDFLRAHNVVAIADIDTRRLTRLLRDKGPLNGCLLTGKALEEFGEARALEEARGFPGLKGMDLAKEVSVKQAYEWNEGVWQWESGHQPATLEKPFHVVAYEFGIKRNILRMIAERNCRVTVVPAQTPADDVLAMNPDGVFLSNGPGDPAATAKFAVPIIKDLVASGLPIFGICMGHQLLATALGCTTQKMHQGHRGANHPIKDLETGKVEITAQNHGFVVSEDLAKGVTVTHRSLFDGTIAGIKCGNTFSVQYHPEASPGPHDSHYLFERFVALVENHKKKAA
jgi:carbamoyl-phosphate synthase small subunit